jgi:hypothetical protein
MSTRRFITLTSAALGATALLLGSAVGSHAQIPPGTINTPTTIAVPPESLLPISDVIAFNGTAPITSDNTNGLLVGCPLGGEPDSPPAVDLVGCGGQFNFTSSICEGVSDGDLGAPEVGGCVVTATGQFQNLVCGTGTVQGTVTITGNDPYTGTFGIIFAATVGVVTGNLTDGSDGSVDYLVGLVQLGPPTNIPPQTPPDTGDCTTQFTVTSVDVGFDL